MRRLNTANEPNSVPYRRQRNFVTNEIDLLPWAAFRWDEEVIRIQATEHFRPKSDESESDIPIDRELLAIFRGYYARSGGEFVIESDCEPNVNLPYGQYRCHREFIELISWLRSKGVASRTPLHALRKEYGSWVNQHFGLVAASETLRHGDIKTTFNHYIENKKRSVIGFSHLLKGERHHHPDGYQRAGCGLTFAPKACLPFACQF